jgi:beta-glucosidase
VRPALEAPPAVDVDAHHAWPREAASASAVLLSNDGALPLDPSTGGTIAVIGELARTPRYQGAGSSRVNPDPLDDALTALQDAVSGDRDISFAPGYVLDGEEADESLLAEAVEQARQAEVVLLFLGLPASYESEGFDRDHLDLPPQQAALLEAVAGVNPDVVVVLSNGAVVTMPWRHQVRAILECWLLGQAGGAAVADLLLGRAVPRGKLAETIPLRHLDTPTIGAFPGEHNEVVYREGLLIGYRWYDSRELDVAFPFGHGLSYTTFGYSDLAVVVLDPRRRRCGGRHHGHEHGSRRAVETVQVYVPTRSARCSGRRRSSRPSPRSSSTRESRRVTLLLDSRPSPGGTCRSSAGSWRAAPSR